MGLYMSPQEAERIKKMFIEGVSVREIHEITGRGMKFLQRNFSNFIKKGPAPEVETLGQKTEPYYDKEEDLLNLPPKYTYEDLSEEEKKIFHGE